MQIKDALIQVLAEQGGDLVRHLSRVATLAGKTGVRLGLPADEIARIRLAAELHDIGKAAVPRVILEKTGPLDAKELAYLRQHSVIGERILAAAPALMNVAPIVRATHERADGGGYPDGLRLDQIPIGARVIAVVDAFDAMTSSRPYQRRRTDGRGARRAAARAAGIAVRSRGRRRLHRGARRARRAWRCGSVPSTTRRWSGCPLPRSRPRLDLASARGGAPVAADAVCYACRQIGTIVTKSVDSTALNARASDSLRVLLANEREERIVLVTAIVVSLGHTVIASSIDISGVGALTVREHPDVALVGLGESSEHALGLIDRIVREATCPVIALLEGHDRAFIDEAAKRGVFAYVVDGDADELAERARHHALPLRRVPQPAGRVRPACDHRAREGHPDGAPLGRRAAGVRAAARPGAAVGTQARRHRTGDRRRALAAAPP